MPCLAGVALVRRLPSTSVPGTIIGLDEFSSMSRLSSVASITSCLMSCADGLKRRAARFEYVSRALQAFVEDSLHFLVDFTGRLFAVMLHRAISMPEYKNGLRFDSRKLIRPSRLMP